MHLPYETSASDADYALHFNLTLAADDVAYSDRPTAVRVCVRARVRVCVRVCVPCVRACVRARGRACCLRACVYHPGKMHRFQPCVICLRR